jgi:hypothetical protein
MNRGVFLHFNRLDSSIFFEFLEIVRKSETLEFLQFSHAIDA